MTLILTTFAFLISTSLFIVIYFLWVGKLKNGSVSLNAEALRNPINAGITVAGFLLPIVVALLSLPYLKADVIVTKGFYLFSSVILFVASIFIGLFNNYGLATLTDNDGTFLITKDNKTTFPSFLIFQVSLLFLGIVFLAIFSFKNVNHEIKNKTDSTKSYKYLRSEIAVMKPYIMIKTIKDSLFYKWGSPNRIIDRDSAIDYIYHSDNSEFIFTLKQDTIIHINEKSLR